MKLRDQLVSHGGGVEGRKYDYMGTIGIKCMGIRILSKSFHFL